jgi:hypothetical protein
MRARPRLAAVLALLLAGTAASAASAASAATPDTSAPEAPGAPEAAGAPAASIAAVAPAALQPHPLQGPARVLLGTAAGAGLGLVAGVGGVLLGGQMASSDGMVAGGVLGAGLGLSLGMWAVGSLMGGDGLLLATVLGAGLGVGAAIPAVIAGGGLLRDSGLFAGFGAMTLCTVVAYEVSSLLVYNARQGALRVSLAPQLVGLRPTGLALSGRF